MPALVKSRFGESGIKLEEGTMVCCFDLKKSRNDWRISELVIMNATRLQRLQSRKTYGRSLCRESPKKSKATTNRPGCFTGPSRKTRSTNLRSLHFLL